jgi:hypothetical protein
MSMNCSHLAEHPEVSGEHEVGGHTVEQAAPHLVLHPHRRVEQHGVVPVQSAILHTLEWTN